MSEDTRGNGSVKNQKESYSAVVGGESDSIKDGSIAGSENVGFPFVRPPSAHSIPRLQWLAL